MKAWYLWFNLLLLSGLLWLMVNYIYPSEYADIKQINAQFDELRDNQQCLDYLQNVTVAPTWRYSLITSLAFTALQVIFYVLAGGVFVEPKSFFMFWLLLFMNWTFIYKVLSNRMWHQVCNHGCSPTFKEI